MYIQLTDIIKMTDIHDSLGHLLSKGSRLLNNRITQNFHAAGLNITREQYTLLNYLWDKDGLNQRDIADICSKDKTSITRQLEVMEKNGLLTRNTDSVDRRIKRIYLTKYAREVKISADKIVHDTFDEVLEGVSENDIKICKDVLEKIQENLLGSSCIKIQTY